ncbi:MAG TPA: serine/threonine-protein kinase [Myxococcaceae bacterium]|jgi:serine/threonine protein kinase
MGMTQSEPVVDPASLPIGMEVGDWRVVSWAGRGTYGTVYRVERRGRESQGPYALKLALHPRDERFKREQELLSRVNHPNVPRLEGHGVWQHPSGNYPYLVMQWVAGAPLYEWAAQRNPTSRQVLRLVAQVARALEATAAVDGLHRDVKGDNVLVRPTDERAFLTDFGAGMYRGAVTLTMHVLPPGTSNYRSPEAWAYERLFALHPSAHYRATVCDELFALGVTAYRLVTDEYPPLTDPRMEESVVWERGGPGPRSPRELNANVSKELNALILRLLGPPERRFKGQARLAAEALEHAASTAGHEADSRLFEWETLARSAWSQEEQRQTEMLGHRPRRRDRDTVQRKEQQDAEAKASGAQPHPQSARSRRSTFQRLLWAVPGAAMFVLAIWPQGKHTTVQPAEEPEENQAEKPKAGTADGGTAYLGEEALAAVSVESKVPLSLRGAVAGKLKGPLPGQRKPPCNLAGEVEIRGGCWLTHPSKKPPCEDNFYEWDGGCYLPIFSQPRVPTSDPR